MELTLTRKWLHDDCVIGELDVDGTFECFTLEDLPRPEKIPGKSAIPEGTYEVIINWSPRFKQRMPLLVNVLDFLGIRIHVGNFALETDGCILVGETRNTGWIGRSRAAYNALVSKLEAAITEGHKISITIKTEASND